MGRLEQLLKDMEKQGYRYVSICKGHIAGLNIEGTHYTGNRKTKLLPEIDGWPAIWRLVERLGYRSSCGNSHQRQMTGQEWQAEVQKLHDLLSKTEDRQQLAQLLSNVSFPDQGGYRINLKTFNIEKLKLLYGDE